MFFAVCVRRQVVVAISGFYVGLYVVFKGLSAVFSSPKKKEVGENHGEKLTDGRDAHRIVHSAWKTCSLSLWHPNRPDETLVLLCMILLSTQLTTECLSRP